MVSQTGAALYDDAKKKFGSKLMRDGKKILVSGSTGFVGEALINHLVRKGHTVTRLVRRPGDFAEKQVRWDIARQQLNPADLEGFDAVIHLAGESIMGRWTGEKKKRIAESREAGTRLLSETLAKLEHPPEALISASATGFYGDRGDEVLTEVSGRGQGFLAQTCEKWEAATRPAAAKGIRVANMRLGVVLHPEGGALKVMYWPFRLGLAGNLGSGRQYFSWIALDDVIGAFTHALYTPTLHGPVNTVAPNPVTNAEFTKTLREKLVPPFLPMHYWTPPAPAPAVKAMMGEMGEQLLLSSQRVQPVRLLETGYPFKYPTLKEALDAML